MALSSYVATAGLLALGFALCGAIYACTATWVTWRFLRQPRESPSHSPSISVLKPLHGGEPELYENLASFCAQDYAGQVQIVLGAHDPADPALDIARQVQRDHPDCDITVVADPTLYGANRKVANLINMVAHARGEVIVISDSDVRIPRDGLGRMVAALERPEVGLIYCLYRGLRTQSAWSQLAAMDINTRFAPSVVAGQALKAHPCLGPTMALRAEVLEKIGGFHHLIDVLADDFELGRTVRAAGHRIGCPPMLIDHVFPERSAREMLTHELRWARTVLAVEPIGYLGSAIVHFLPLALIGAALTGFSPLGAVLLGALAVLRLAHALVLSRLLGADHQSLWLVPLRDLLSFGVFVVAICGDRVEWRGKRFKIVRGGAIAAVS